MDKVCKGCGRELPIEDFYSPFMHGGEESPLSAWKEDDRNIWTEETK